MFNEGLGSKSEEERNPKLVEKLKQIPERKSRNRGEDGEAARKSA